MLQRVKTLSNLTKVLVLAIAALMTVSCSKDDNPMAPKNDGNPFAGSYISNYRWGGASGLWRGATPLEITKKGEVTYGGTLIKKPVFTEYTLVWTIADGNRQNASMKFAPRHDSDFYWRDKGGSVDDENFTGSIQNPGEGPLDFRALIVD